MVKSIIGTTLADVKVGVGLNFNALDGVESQPLDGSASVTPKAPTLFNFFTGSYSTAPEVKYPSFVPVIDASGVRDLLTNRIDFLSISAYYPYTSASFAATEFQNSAVSVATGPSGLSTLVPGLNLESLSNSKLELHYGEFGIGCGVDGNSGIAPSADACSKAPWAGICGRYSAASDPWQRSYLSTFRTSFYNKALGWLSSADSYTYKISEVFVWSMSSWDVFGIYPDSMGYRDMSIARTVAAHNAAVIAAQVCEYGDAQVCNRYVAGQSACLNDLTGAACLNRPDPTVVTEAGPAQSASAPAPASPPSPRPTSSADNSNSSASDMAAGPLDDFLSGTAAVSPVYMQGSQGSGSVITSPDNPNIIFVGIEPQKPTSAITNSTSAAGSRQLRQALSGFIPLLCAGLLLLLL
jgi:hypothetical protein